MQQKKFLTALGTRSQILTVLLIPALILITYGIINNIYHLESHKKLLMFNYTNELNSFLKDTEDKMTLAINSASFIATNNKISYALTTTEKPDTTTASSIVLSLKTAEEFLDIIDNIAVYNKAANFVVTPTGMYDPNIYFNTICPYSNYNHEYWSSYRSITSKIQILAPTLIESETSSGKKTIVPLVFTSLENTSSNNLVIFNINMNNLFEHFELYRLTPNTKLYMIDNTTGNMYSDSSLSTNDNLEYTFLQSIKNSLQSDADIVSINRQKHLLIKSTQRSSSWGFSYLVTVPYSDISKEVATILFMSVLLILLLFAITIIFIGYASAHLYAPWKKAATAIGAPSNQSQNNIIDYVTNSIISLSDLNRNLKNSLDVALPLSQEKYLINVLNNDINSESTNDDLMSLNFKYKYFAAISINIAINPDFLSELGISYSFMQKRIKNTIKSFFSEKFQTYELPGSKNIVYLLLNLENDSYNDEITNLINSIETSFVYDKDNLNIVFSAGKIYEGLNGLKLTHQESLSNMIQHLNTSEIQFSTSKAINLFSANTENIFTNYLKLGLIDKSKELLTNIFNSLANEPVSNQKQAYIDIANCIKKILLQKDMKPSIPSIEYAIDIINKNIDIPVEQIQNAFFDILDKIDEHMQINSKKFKIEEVIEYINEHYTENIFLDDLAQKYNISSKHLSKKIKQYLGITFKDYLTQLKINKAKELIAETDIPINELFSMVGFQDRVSFTRTFKQKTGVSPSAYRKSIRSVSQDHPQE